MKKHILYGSADYEEIIAENGYFVDNDTLYSSAGNH